MAEPLKPEDSEEIQGILTDLDSILSGMGVAHGPAQLPASTSPPDAALGTVQTPKPQSPASLPPVAGSKEAPSVKPVELKIELSPQSGILKPSSVPKPSTAPIPVTGAPQKTPVPGGTEASRTGTGGKDGPPFPAPPGALPHVSSYKPPLEISLSPPKPPPSSAPGGNYAPGTAAEGKENNLSLGPGRISPAGGKEVPPLPAAPGVERPGVAPKVPVLPAKTPALVPPPAAKAPAPIVSPVPGPVPAAKSPASSSAPVFVEIPAAGLGEPIADNVPKEQIRSLAFLYSAACRDKFPSFIQFIDSVALHLTKKPLYLRKVLVLEVPVDVEMAKVVERVGKSHVAAAVGLLSDLNVREMEEAFSEAEIFFRSVRPEDIGKRSTALDLLVDVTLLAPG